MKARVTVTSIAVVTGKAVDSALSRTSFRICWGFCTCGNTRTRDGLLTIEDCIKMEL